MIGLSRAVAGGILVALALAARAPAPARAEGAVATRRMAVVVGANAAAPGRKPLRFAQRDARAVAQVLRDLAGFAGGDVSLLLDPRPEEILGALDAALREAARARADTLVLFYYSGHADTASLFPGGRPLSLVDLRRRLDDGRAAMRIGIIDACRGGGWTGSKGLSASQTFDIEQAFDLATEGSILIASSSGLEDAHESLSLRGSFFTHHWNAGLRGAGDRNGDDKVTVGEAFEYARALTIRDTALETENPQHPSFRFNLRGRGDPPLAELSPGSSVIELDQTSGPLQIIHLGTGLMVVELPAGKRRARVSLSPGHYLVRRRAGRAVLAREVRLGASRRVAVTEASLTPVAIGTFEAKGTAVESPGPSDRPPSEFLLSFSRAHPTYAHIEQWTEPIEGDLYTSDHRAQDPSWTIQGSYLMRHGRHLASRFGVGYSHAAKYGNGGLVATLGEAVSLPLLRTEHRIPTMSRYVIEPYLAAHVSARAELDKGYREMPYQVQAGLAGGVRLYFLYAQIGYAMDLVPNRVTFDSGSDSSLELSDPQPGMAFEVGIRLVDLF